MRTPALFLLGFVASFGQTAPKYDKTEGYVSDFARVLDSASQIDIERVCREVETSTGVQIAVVTVPTLDGEPIEDFTNSLARKWGVGQKGSNQGLMLLLAIGDRKTRTEVGYGLEAVMPDGFVGGVQRSMREELRAGKYGEAILKAVTQFQRRIEDSKIGVPAPTDRPVRQRGFQQSRFPFWVMIALLLFFFLVIPWLSRRGRRNGYRRGGGYYGGGGGGFPIWTSGGFGGSSDSGGGGGGSDSGFGGFGGGDFGGGGSSSDW